MLGDKLLRAIGAAGLTRREAARRVGVAESSVSRLVRTGTGVSLEVFLKLAELTGASLDWLTDDAAPDSPVVYRQPITLAPVVGRLVSQRDRPSSSSAPTPRTAARRPRRKA